MTASTMRAVDQLTVLRRPGDEPEACVVDQILAGPPWDYRVEQVGPRWTVRHIATWDAVYVGEGPVELLPLSEKPA